MTDDAFEDLRREARDIADADTETRERVWLRARTGGRRSPRFARLWRARVLLPIAAAYLVAVPVATAVAVGRSDSAPGLQFGNDARYGTLTGNWRKLDEHCPKPSKDAPLRACAEGARIAGKSTIYMNGVAPDGARRITIRFADRTTARARIEQGAFLLSIPLAQQAWASDLRITVTGADGKRSRTLALDDVMGFAGFGYRIEHDYRRNHPCPPA
jgi:hypothetical protein